MMKNSPLIKVCGIRTVEEARLAIDAGANTLGFLLGLTHKADDSITEDNAAHIIASLPDSLDTVMVTHLLDSTEIVRMAKATGVSTIQIHDDLSVAEMKQLRTTLPAIPLIKAIHVTGPEALEKARLYEAVSDYLLLDSRTADRLGGTGMTHDWALSAAIVESSSRPVILAGGLNPENVGDAIAQVKPDGVDANSGLEHPDGSKDFEKMKTFVTEALHAFP